MGLEATTAAAPLLPCIIYIATARVSYTEAHASARKVVVRQSRPDLGDHIRIWKENLHIRVIK
jgi:hypothetical protein